MATAESQFRDLLENQDAFLVEIRLLIDGNYSDALYREFCRRAARFPKDDGVVVFLSVSVADEVCNARPAQAINAFKSLDNQARKELNEAIRAEVRKFNESLA